MATADLYVNREMLCTCLSLLPNSWSMESAQLDTVSDCYILKVFCPYLPREVKRVSMTVTETEWTRTVTMAPVEE